MPAKYVLTQKGKSFHWSLLATNGRVIATSEVYNTKASAMAGIRSVQKNGATDVVVTADELKDSRAATKRPAKKAGGATAVKRTTAAKRTTGAAASTSASASGTAKKTAAKRAPAKKAASAPAAKAPAKKAAKRAPAKRS